MYVRTVTRRNKDGSVVRYLQLAHNEWDPQKKCAVARVLYNFGREEEVDREAVRRLVESLTRLLPPVEAAETQARLQGLADVRAESSRPLGGAWLLDHLWQRFGIDVVLGRLLAERRFKSPVERALFALVANRALAPSSKLRVEDWVARQVVIPNLPQVAVQHLYRAMDFLLAAGEELQREVFFRVANLLNLEVDLLYFDTTSTYFEIEEPDAPGEGIRRHGYSRDRRGDLPQVVVGLAVTKEGLPVRCWVWPGNTNDVSVVQEVKRDLAGWRLGRVIMVVDRGCTSEDNLAVLMASGGHYIAGEYLRRGKAAVEEVLRQPGRYTIVRQNLEVKEVYVGVGESRERYILVRNPQQAARDRAAREEVLAELRTQLAALKKDARGYAEKVCALLEHPRFKHYLVWDAAAGRLKIDQARVRAEARLDGKYLLRTSDSTLTPEQVALGYKQLLEVEEAWRTLKHTLSLRPVYHRLEDRIRAHVLLCWLALLLVRVAENATGSSWAVLRDELQLLHLVELRAGKESMLVTTSPTAAMRGIFEALNLPLPPRVYEARTGRRKAKD